MFLEGRQVLGGKKIRCKGLPRGKEKIIRFGDANMSIKKATQHVEKVIVLGQLELRVKSNKLSANYWSRRAWNC